jgi:aryl-alcohol dehydrogenase-like predicted oxidoreductase
VLFGDIGETGLKVSVLGLGDWHTFGTEKRLKEVDQTARCT